MKKPIDPNLNDDIYFGIDGGSDFNIQENEASFSLKSNDEIKPVFDKSSHETHHSSSGSSHHHHHSRHHHHHHSRHHRHHRKRKINPFVKFLIVLVSVVLVIALVAGGTFAFLDKKGRDDMTKVVTQTNYDEVIEYNGNKYAYNKDVVSIAFIGVDKRELEGDEQIGTAGQADADLVLTLNTKTGKAKVIAVPRDTMVDVDLYDTDGKYLRSENMQLCLSYAYGNGRETSAENVTTSLSRILYNVPINKYFVLDLDGIKPLNDAIGGVTVESMYEFKDEGIKVGDEVTLTGDMTEKYVRQRDMDTIDASLNRTARQVQYVKAFARQLVPSVLDDFSVVSKLYNTASQYSVTNIDLSNITYLASLMVSKGVTDFETVTLDGEMKESTRKDYADFVYAEFYPDENSTMEIILDTFYTKLS